MSMYHRKIAIVLFLLLLMTLAIGGCTSSQQPSQTVEQEGNDMTVPADNAQKIPEVVPETIKESAAETSADKPETGVNAAPPESNDQEWSINDFVTTEDISGLVGLPVLLSVEHVQSYGEQLLAADFSIDGDVPLDHGMSISIILNEDVALEQYNYNYSSKDNYSTLEDVPDIGSHCFLALREYDDNQVELAQLAAIKDGVYYSVTYKNRMGLNDDYKDIIRKALDMVIDHVEAKTELMQ